jgi:putative aldouronate transport system substrate-binding protein
MNKPSRRQFLAGAGAGAVAAGLGACSSSNGSSGSGGTAGSMSSYAVGTAFKATQPLTFSIMMLSNPNYPYNANWPFFKDLKQMTNVGLNATVIPGTDYNTKRSAIINAGNAPMIIPKTYPGQENEYVAGGAILPVSDYVHLMPNFQAAVAKWNLQGNLDQLKQSDGKYYLLPGLHENVWLDYTLAVRTDIMSKLGISTPQTWDDVHTMLTKMKQAYPSVTPFSDRWNQPTPGGALLNILSMSYGTAAGWGFQSPNQGAYWDAASKTWVATGAMPQFQQVVQYLNTLHSEGLIDPESFTQSDDAAIQKFVTGKSFVITTNAQSLVNDYRSALKIPGATVAKIPVPLGPLGAVIAENGASRLENGVMISAKALKSPNFTALMQFVDWLWYSDAGKMFAKWGVQGTTYTGSIADNTFKLNPNIKWAGINPTAPKSLQVDYGFFNGVFAYGGSTAFLDSQFTPEELTFQNLMNQRKLQPLAPPAPLSSQDQQQVTLWGTTLMDYVQQQELQFIQGTRPLSQWSAYVSELNGKNQGQLVSTINSATTSFNKKFG